MVIQTARPLHCVITDLDHFALAQLPHWADRGIDLVQLRAKHLPGGDLFRLARHAAGQLASIRRVTGRAPQLLVNGRPDVALAAGADGVHLTARPGELTPGQVRTLFLNAGRAIPTVGVSCHNLPDVQTARTGGADFVLFGPIFEKRVDGELIQPGVGLETLRRACIVASGITPVLALGGVTPANTAQCLAAGAAGVAGIRLFAP